MVKYDYSYRVLFSGCARSEEVLRHGRDFLVDEEALCCSIGCSLPPRARDLLRIAMAVYTVDRLAKRKRRDLHGGPIRSIRLTVGVTQPSFWRSEERRALLSKTLNLLSDDFWDLNYTDDVPKTQGCFTQSKLPWSTVCLFSGGLDSAAGLAHILRHQHLPVFAVTALHQSHLRARVRDQIQQLARYYKAPVFPVKVRTELRGAPRLSEQEVSQRCRAFLFASLGGAIACATGASTIQICENGVGSVNLPLMVGMQVGARNTKSAHPRFLQNMSRLVSEVAGRRVQFVLPFRDETKAQMIQGLSCEELDPVLQSTISCSHYPQRMAGSVHSCGVCASCIERRQAMYCGGLEENTSIYRYDWLNGPDDFAKIPDGKLNYLKATLMQIAHLDRSSRKKPSSFIEDHFYGTGIVKDDQELRQRLKVLHRYKDEWLDLIDYAKQQNLPWSNWVRRADN